MRIAHVTRPRFETLDYSQREEATELIVPLVRRTHPTRRGSSIKRGVLARPRTPMIVDKELLARVLGARSADTPAPRSRVPRLSRLCLEHEREVEELQRRDGARRRRRAWALRVSAVLFLGLGTVLALRPSGQTWLRGRTTAVRVILGKL